MCCVILPCYSEDVQFVHERNHSCINCTFLFGILYDDRELADSEDNLSKG